MSDDNYNKIEEDKVAYQSRYFTQKEKNNTMFIPTEGESLKTWMARQGRAVFESRECNIITHINNGKQPWWSHRSSGPCFMCDDLTHIKIQHELLEALSDHIDYNKLIWHFHDDRKTTDDPPPYWIIVKS